MKKFFLLGAALFAVSVLSQAQEPARFGIKSGYVKTVSEQNGQVSTTQLWFDDYGAVERTVVTMPMGELGDYKFVHSGTICLGATMNSFAGKGPGWQFYFMVDDVDAAVERLTGAGGRVIQGPDEIPGGSFSVVAADPEGAAFGFVGERRA